MKKILILYFLVCVLNGGVSQSFSQSYPDLLKEIESTKSSLSKRYEAADNSEKQSIIQEAEDYLVTTITLKMFNYWYGTPWDFNGISTKPGEGKIACGYFVVHILLDAGFDVPRFKWGQSAAEELVKKAANNHIKRFSNKPVEDVVSYLNTTGNGLYIVGLDNHIGFISVNGNQMRFIHSNYYQPEIGVMSERLYSENPFNDSGYRVIGKLFSDEMIRNWINDHRYE